MNIFWPNFFMEDSWKYDKFFYKIIILW